MSKADQMQIMNVLFYSKLTLCVLLALVILVCFAVAYVRWLDNKENAKEYLKYAGLTFVLLIGVFVFGPSVNVNGLKPLYIALKVVLCFFFLLLFLISLFVRRHMRQLGKDNGSTAATILSLILFLAMLIKG